MQVMPGWTIELIDVVVGIVELVGLIVIGLVIRIIKQIVEFDVAAEECRDECYCANSGQRDQADTCGSCGCYCETGHGE